MSAAPPILAVDLGTQSLRLAAVEADGARSWTWSCPVSTTTRGGISEQASADWDAGLRDGLAEAERAGVRPAAVAAAGPLAGWVPLDADGRALGPAVMYFDGRSAQDLARLTSIEGPREDGLRPTIADVVPQLMRLRREEPETAARMVSFLDATGFLVRRLAGTATLDAYTALRRPTDEVARRLQLDLSCLGRTVAVGEQVGTLRPELAARFGGGRIPVIAATFDSKCAYIAGGIREAGEALDISGTVTSFGLVANRRIVDPSRRIYSVPLGAKWLVRGSMGGTGSILEWARSTLFGTEVDGLDLLASGSPPGARGVTFLPFHSGVRAPNWRPDARGVVLGLSLDTSRADLARAMFEGFAFGLRHIADTMGEHDLTVRSVRLAGGLARSEFLSKLKADVLGCSVDRPADHELTTLGLAVIAHTAIGHFSDATAAARTLVRVADRIEPGERCADLEAAYRRYLQAVEAHAPPLASMPT